MLQDDKHLGEKYEIVAVKPIFARNVLLPQNIAVLADKANKNKYEQKMQAAIVARTKKAASLDELFAKMAENGGVELTRKANKDRVLYAKVNESDIAEAIKEAYGIEVDSHLFKLKKKINEVGSFVVPFMYKDMKKEVTVVVKAERQKKNLELKEKQKKQLKRLKKLQSLRKNISKILRISSEKKARNLVFFSCFFWGKRYSISRKQNVNKTTYQWKEYGRKNIKFHLLYRCAMAHYDSRCPQGVFPWRSQNFAI